MFFALVVFSLTGIGYEGALFQACKICALNQWNALVLIAKCTKKKKKYILEK